MSGQTDLANPAGILFLCRLQNFIDVFERLSNAEQALHTGSSSSQLQVPWYFWIDTLAMPTGNEYQEERRKAIRNMHQMYTLATYTVVLDAGLMALPRGGNYAETAMKITTSYWITRLWTLQEAFLSKRLLFNFSDTLVDMDGLKRMEATDLLSPVSLAARSYYWALLGQERHRMLRGRERGRSSRETDRLINLSFLTSLWNALQLRTTSHAQHETLAIATLLRINTDPFDDVMISATSEFQSARTRLDEKMQKLLSMIAQVSNSAIPAEMIFLAGPKLTGRGFRWAPRSWLQNQSPMTLGLSSSQQQGAHLTLEGLLLRYPGFKLHATGTEDKAMDTMSRIVFPVDTSLSSWIVVHDADSTDTYQTATSRKDFAIVTQDQHVGTNLQVALLVAVIESKDKVLYAHILKRVLISTEKDTSRAAEYQKAFHSDPQGAIVGDALYADQQWCLDGPEQMQTSTSRETFWPLSGYPAWLPGWPIRFSTDEKSKRT